MKIGIITTPNKKGQIVIPKKIREKFGINEETALNILPTDYGFWVYPIEEIGGKMETDSAYSKILEKTRGMWELPAKQELRREKLKRELELKASKKRKRAW